MARGGQHPVEILFTDDLAVFNDNESVRMRGFEHLADGHQIALAVVKSDQIYIFGPANQDFGRSETARNRCRRKKFTDVEKSPAVVGRILPVVGRNAPVGWRWKSSHQTRGVLGLVYYNPSMSLHVCTSATQEDEKNQAYPCACRKYNSHGAFLISLI